MEPMTITLLVIAIWLLAGMFVLVAICRSAARADSAARTAPHAERWSQRRDEHTLAA